MNKKTSKPSVPAEIMDKIQTLNTLLTDASQLYNDIFDWYEKELHSYNPTVNASDELFDPSTTHVSGISYLEIMEGLSIVQTFNEV